MRIGKNVLFKVGVLLIGVIYCSNLSALLDVSGKGNVEDRKELKLLYTFDEPNSSNKIYNQIYKNDENHPTHLIIKGKRSNITLENGAVNFTNNAVLPRGEYTNIRQNVADRANQIEGNEAFDKQVETLRRLSAERVYLESQGDVRFDSLCTNDDQLTLQVFFKPQKINYSRFDANMFGLQPHARTSGTVNMTQDFNANYITTTVNSRKINWREGDFVYSPNGISGVQNESVLTWSLEDKIDGYFLLHTEGGKEGWESGFQTTGDKKINSYAGSKVLIGTYPLLYGAAIGPAISTEVTRLIAKRKVEISSGKYANSQAEWQNFMHRNLGGYVGSFQSIAFYCRSAKKAEVLGGEYLDTTKIKVTPDLVGEPTQSEKLAVRILSLLSKKKIPIDAALVKQAAEHIARGDYKKAAQVGVNLPDFYNNTVKDFALQMSNREETVDAPLNDFSATLIGSVRDGIDARQLLTGNYYYRANKLVGVPADEKKHMLESNLHYETLDKDGYDLKKALVKVDGQKIIGTGTIVTNHPDPAGLLTSRAFMQAHAVAGTNRRQVEFAFKQFMCVEMSDMADTDASDLRIGRDIDRFPGASHKKYLTSCKGCHTVMDGFRGAFAKTDFDESGGFAKHGGLLTIGKKPYLDIATKVNHNDFVFPKGYVSNDDSFYNFANRGSNKLLFGWRTPASKGFGMGQFSNMLAQSQRFSKCMVKRVFEAVCPVKINEDILAKLIVYVKDFEQNNYDLKNLFMNAVISPLCIGGN